MKIMPADNFIDIPFTLENIDRYYVRTSILAALKNNLAAFNGKLLDIGCGKMPYKKFLFANSSIESYIGLDIENALIYDAEVKPDAFWDGCVMPFTDESFDTVIGTEVLEHCPDPESTLKEVHRVLSASGVFFFTVPFLWPLHEVPHDEYRYTPYALERLLKNAGFSTIKIEATGGWHASMAQMLGLWLKRSPLGVRQRKYLSYALKPIISILLNMEIKSKHSLSFGESQMITGLSGFCKK